ncbi:MULTISPECIES: hypothetical protein [unclassified Mesorhizobium]|uniref:hypothetical protein n=1 Tax=unclassified Mesorhizobium TaxID=325217 RepID=UPI001CC91456|nr:MULTISPECIES: hypothetical protein [unclassified Mesorhizobium]MBZ9704484.1 hypothetical protein [Mesorhizobium sp. CO1-1-3]MBZ9917403.1 hypothetical protein [Mesorhizobium sp. BR1-1-7]MBZ9949657.1 hypothetical protein [Mesorhizobium sp. BR1-1-11]MBZ9954892.1 hypothetical protein [Mesorhizobium sp. BR1-1-15]MBZ9970907.1 hypothetical protein [Mesorhizobium sp. BR1-1-12]
MTILEKRKVMARTPAEGSGHRPNQSPSPEDRATGRRVLITLTASARHYAGKQVIAEPIEALQLGSDCAVGDLVSLVKAGTQHDFAVICRRWICKEQGIELELTLDHPARSSGR